MRHRALAALLAASVGSAGCVHTTPNPVPLSQVGDNTISCRTVENQMQDMQNQIRQSNADGNRQVWRNVGLGIAGALVLIPWFFIDTSDAHSIDAKAASDRFKRLRDLSDDGRCAVSPTSEQPATQAAIAEPAGALAN